MKIPDNKENLSFLGFVKHLFYQSEEGSLEHYLKENLKVRSFSFSDYNDFMSIHTLALSFKIDAVFIRDEHRIKFLVSTF